MWDILNSRINSQYVDLANLPFSIYINHRLFIYFNIKKKYLRRTFFKRGKIGRRE